VLRLLLDGPAAVSTAKTQHALSCLRRQVNLDCMHVCKAHLGDELHTPPERIACSFMCTCLVSVWFRVIYWLSMRLVGAHPPSHA
jgi:hypothetical protein